MAAVIHSHARFYAVIYTLNLTSSTQLLLYKFHVFAKFLPGFIKWMLLKSQRLSLTFFSCLSRL